MRRLIQSSLKTTSWMALLHDRPSCYANPVTKTISLEMPFTPKESFWSEVADAKSLADAPKYVNNIERYVGTVKIPVGMIGPVKVEALTSNSEKPRDIECLVPIATTEGALCASYNRGARAITQSGGSTAAVLSRQMVRAPYFTFDRIVDAARFFRWFNTPNVQRDLRDLINNGAHRKLEDLHAVQTDYSVHIHIGLNTCDAAGQNMVTYCGREVMSFVASRYKDGPIGRGFIEGGFNSGKRGSNLHFRGKGLYTVVDALIPESTVTSLLHTNVHDLVRFQRTHLKTSTFIGTLSYTAHVANGLTAFYIANGQDPACVAESQAGVTHFESRTKDGKEYLYASMTLPSIIVATVGGGTQLPSQKACLDFIPVEHPEELACVVAAMCLGGEISFYAAMSAGEFDGAHWNATHKGTQP